LSILSILDKMMHVSAAGRPDLYIFVCKQSCISIVALFEIRGNTSTYVCEIPMKDKELGCLILSRFKICQFIRAPGPSYCIEDKFMPFRIIAFGTHTCMRLCVCPTVKRPKVHTTKPLALFPQHIWQLAYAFQPILTNLAPLKDACLHHLS
jgi:hypothetical protein